MRIRGDGGGAHKRRLPEVSRFLRRQGRPHAKPSGTVSNFSYDNIYELTQVTQGGSTTESYTYDPVGNRLTSLAGSFSNNSSNEMTASPTATYTYDYNGNTLTKVVGSNTTSFSWDFENRMTSVTLPGSGGTVSFKYDPFGRRIYKSSSSGTSVFAYDGDNLAEETNSSGTAVARYADGLNIDEPLAMLRGGATSFYHADGLGSVTSLSSSAGSIANTYTYDSFGNLTASTGSVTNPFRYTARESDTETGLYYYRARYYDQGTSRFLNEDPLAFKGALNFYAYVDNDPQDYEDPFGLRKYKCDLLGNCVHLPSGSHGLPPVPNSGGSSLVNQQLNAYRNCVASGIKGIKDPPPRPPDPTLGVLGGLEDMKPNAHPMPGDPSGPFAFPDPKPSAFGPSDGLAVVDDLSRQFNCWKRGRVADACADRFPLAKLSREF